MNNKRVLIGTVILVATAQLAVQRSPGGLGGALPSHDTNPSAPRGRMDTPAADTACHNPAKWAISRLLG